MLEMYLSRRIEIVILTRRQGFFCYNAVGLLTITWSLMIDKRLENAQVIVTLRKLYWYMQVSKFQKVRDIYAGLVSNAGECESRKNRHYRTPLGY